MFLNAEVTRLSGREYKAGRDGQIPPKFRPWGGWALPVDPREEGLASITPGARGAPPELRWGGVSSRIWPDEMAISNAFPGDMGLAGALNPKPAFWVHPPTSRMLDAWAFRPARVASGLSRSEG